MRLTASLLIGTSLAAIAAPAIGQTQSEAAAQAATLTTLRMCFPR